MYLEESSRLRLLAPVASWSCTPQGFPSLNQDFLLLSLRAMGLPDAFVLFASFLRAAVQGIAARAGRLQRVFWIRSGILQGRALSGTLRQRRAS